MVANEYTIKPRVEFVVSYPAMKKSNAYIMVYQKITDVSAR